MSIELQLDEVQIVLSDAPGIRGPPSGPHWLPRNASNFLNALWVVDAHDPGQLPHVFA